MVFRSSRSFTKTPSRTVTAPAAAPTPATPQAGRRRRRRTEASDRRPQPAADVPENARASDRRKRSSLRPAPTKVTLSADGEIGRVGSQWWERRGQRLFRLAKGRSPSDPVLATCALAAAQFEGWDDEELPAGAQRIYDTISKLVDKLETASDGELPEEGAPKSDRPTRRGRRARRRQPEAPETTDVQASGDARIAAESGSEDSEVEPVAPVEAATEEAPEPVELTEDAPIAQTEASDATVNAEPEAEPAESAESADANEADGDADVTQTVASDSE